MKDLPIRLTWVKQAIYSTAVRADPSVETFTQLDTVFSTNFFAFVCINKVKSLQEFYKSGYTVDSQMERVLALYGHMVFDEVAHSVKINQMINKRLILN